MCGGTARLLADAHGDAGLSPRVRGNLAGNADNRRAGRSIPACAGEPRLADPRGQRAAVYPRVCGGTVDGGLGARIVRGLSPRVRGNLDIAVQGPQQMRSIPACAGEPLSDLYLLTMLEGCKSIVLHQVDSVSIDDLFGRIAENPYALAAYC